MVAAPESVGVSILSQHKTTGQTIGLSMNEAAFEWLNTNPKHGLKMRELAEQIRPHGYKISRSSWSRIIQKWKVSK